MARPGMKTDALQMKNRVGCSSISFRHLPLPKALDKIQELGFGAVDIGVLPAFCPHIDLVHWTANDTVFLAAGLAERKLRVSSLNVNPSGLAICHPDEPLEFLALSLKIASGLGARTVTLQTGPSTAENEWLQEARGVAQRIRHLAEVGGQLGLRVSVEAPHTGTLASTYEQSARLFDLINDPRVGCTFDTSHAQLNNPQTLVEGITAVGAEILHVHLRDVLGRSFAVTPGKGICDFAPFVKALVERGYEGDFNLELECAPAAAEAEVCFARDYLQMVLDGKPLPPEYAAWRTRQRRLALRVRDLIANPKLYLTSQPWYEWTFKPVVRPFVKLARASSPVNYRRYESSWRRRHYFSRPIRVELEAPARDLPAGARTKRVAILGCGTIGHHMQAPSFASIAGVKMVGVCDTNFRLAEATGKLIGCPAFKDLAELINQAKPELVANCTTEAMHSSTTLQLLEQGVDVFCEKIMAESIASGEAMVRRAAERGRVLAVNFNWRFLPAIQKIRQIKEAGTLGELCLLRIVCHSWVWHHMLDLVSFLGGKPISLTAQSRQDPLFEDRRPWRRFADEMLYLPGVYGMAMLETRQGVGASITSSNLWNPYGCLFGLDAVFRRGVITLSGIHMADALGILSCDQKEVNLRLTPEETTSTRTYAITFKRSITAFMDAYLQGKSPPTSGEDALFTMRMERAVVESATTGRKVCFP